MPIYEYRCGSCKRKVSIFFPSISAAETRAAAGEVRCPNCSSADLTRLMSRFYAIRSDNASDDDLSDMGDFGGDNGLMPGLDEDDPRAVARWARQMKESMGSEMDMGPGFDQALARIEAGEDPDKVMDDIDPEELGGGMAGEDGYDDMGGDDLGPEGDFSGEL